MKTERERNELRALIDARRRELVADVNGQEAQKVYGPRGRLAREDRRLAARDDETMGVREPPRQRLANLIPRRYGRG